MTKLMLYLDTNMILDVFINHAMAIKKKEEVLLPKKYKFMLANKERIDFMASFLTKAEVVRELHSAYGLEYDEISPVWKKFIESLDCTYLESFTFDGAIAQLAGKMKMRTRTMFNLLHIFIAISKDAYFISGDTDALLKSKGLELHQKVISYTEFRKMIEEGGI